MTILHAGSAYPLPAHHGTLSSKASIRENGLLEKKENSSPGSCEDTNRICIQGLLMCARLALDKWSHEPQVLSSLTRLLSVLSIHSPSP